MADDLLDDGMWPFGHRPAWAGTWHDAPAVVPGDVEVVELADGFEYLTRIESRLSAAKAALAATAAVRVRAAGSSMASEGFIAELATRLHVSEYSIVRSMETAERLAALPLISEALREGRLTWRHAEEVTAAAVGLPPSLLAEFEAEVLPVAEEHTPLQVRDRARRIRDLLDPTGMAERHEEAARRRAVVLDPAPDGMARLIAEFEVLDAVAIKHRLRAAAIALHDLPGETRCIGELETDVARDLLLAELDEVDDVDGLDAESADDAHREADPGEAEDTSAAEAEGEGEGEVAAVVGEVVTDLAGRIAEGERRLADSARHRVGTRRVRHAVRVVPQVQLIVPVDLVADALPAVVPTETDAPPLPAAPEAAPSVSAQRVALPPSTGAAFFRPPPTKPCAPMPFGFIPGYGSIDPVVTLRAFAAAPTFARIITDAATGTVMDVGSGRCRVPADLKRWLEIRDETCRFPGCRRAARTCDVDHTLAVEHDGDTVWDNLEHLCRRHHRLKHEAGWTPWQDAFGGIHWTSPYRSRNVVTQPAFRMATPDPEDEPAPQRPRTQQPLPDDPPF